MYLRLSTLASFLLIGLAWATPTFAVVVKLHEGSKTIHGRLIRLTPETLVVDQLDASGNARRLEFQREEIAEISLNVSDDRLADLDPRQPDMYMNYAEELLPLRHDPDAHYTAMRLYLIAGSLAPDRHGNQALRRLIELARNRTEERALRAMLHLHQATSSQHAPPALTDQRPESVLNSNAVEGLVTCLRALRSGDRRRAASELARPDVRAALGKFQGHLTVDEIQAVIHGNCEKCLDGRVDCERCGGSGTITTGNGQMTCPNCRGAALVQCASCRGRDFFARPSDDQMKKILAFELEVLDQRSKGKNNHKGSDLRSSYQNWTLTQQIDSPAIMILNWSNVTEFDPSQSIYVGDRWVKP